MRAQRFGVAAAIVAAATAIFQLPQLKVVDGLSIDYLFWLRNTLLGAPPPSAAAPAVVVAIDEETYRTDPFAGKPQALWTPQIAKVLAAILAGGAKVVGFDVIFPTSMDAYISGFDRDFLLALHDGARDNRVLLAKVQHEALPISPFPGQSFAVGNERNIRTANLVEEGDDVIRAVPLTIVAKDLKSGTRRETAFALELAARAAGVAVREEGGQVMFGDRPIPGSESNSMLLNFRGGDEVPTYSLADLFACAQAGRDDYFAAHFKNRAVLFGTALDVEDRKLTSRRLINRPQPRSSADRCVLPPRADLAVPRYVSLADVPGVYVQATAIDNFVLGDMLRTPPVWLRVLCVGLTVGASVAILLSLPVGTGIAASFAPMLVAVGVAIAAFRSELVLPMLPAILAALLGGVAIVAYRVLVADRDKRWLRGVFGLYLAPEVVDRLAAAEHLPELGGEKREMTFLFSDVADFTTLSERIDAQQLTTTINEYLQRVCDVIMKHGGMVVDFAGDGVFAIFGAPERLADHRERAIDCALDLDACCEHFRQEQEEKRPGFGHTRIGLHSGEAIVGNFGSGRRLKYSALGDAVNTASRIEGVNKFFKTRIAASADAVRGAEKRCRPLGEIRLKGKDEFVPLFEVLTKARAESAYVAGYRDAYELLKRNDTGAPRRARELLDPLAHEDPSDHAVGLYIERLNKGQAGVRIEMHEK